MTVIEIGNDSHFQSLVNSTKSCIPHTIFVKFSASWCVPCRRIAPTYEILSKRFSLCGFYHADIKNCENAALSNGIKKLPTFLAIQCGICVGRLVSSNINDVNRFVRQFATNQYVDTKKFKKSEKKEEKDDYA